jgi:hypothetical protein
MNDIDIPILKKSYELYQVFHDYRKLVLKSDRFTIFERSEDVIIDVIELFLEAGYSKNTSVNKFVILEKASVKLNTLRFLIRLMKDTKSLDTKKYIILQEMIDEIGRMLGGWIRSSGR